MSKDLLSQVKTYFLNLQESICKGLEQEEEGAEFLKDLWHHETGGGGCTRVMSEGKVFEKAGVNFSHVQGNELPRAATAHRPQLAGRAFDATGVSLVIHPLNPYVPTVHANWRFFIASQEGADPVWWFGGGMDLTPYYGDHSDCVEWHQKIKEACDSQDLDYYTTFKKWCDDYFYLPHRKEHRGIGGIFFDDFQEKDFAHSFDFVKAVSEVFLKAYLPIVRKHKHTPYGERERHFQQYRRGRYVEFNLVYDRGTLFGLQTEGRTESILMSLPPLARWIYDWHPEPHTKEAELTDYFLKPRDWVGE